MRLLAAPAFFAAHEALPWVALGWALYGLFLVLVTIAGRAQVTTRNFPAALAGLVVNVVAPGRCSSAPLGIAGAGIALCGAYVVMLAPCTCSRAGCSRCRSSGAALGTLVVVIGGITVAGELLLPDAGAGGLRRSRRRRRARSPSAVAARRRVLGRLRGARASCSRARATGSRSGLGRSECSAALGSADWRPHS